MSTKAECLRKDADAVVRISEGALGDCDGAERDKLFLRNIVAVNLRLFADRLDAVAVSDAMVESVGKALYIYWDDVTKSAQGKYREKVRAALESVLPIADEQAKDADMSEMGKQLRALANRRPMIQSREGAQWRIDMRKAVNRFADLIDKQADLLGEPTADRAIASAKGDDNA